MKSVSLALVTSLLLASSTALSNITGSDVHNFNPTYDGQVFTTVWNSSTLNPGTLGLSLYSDYSFNTLPRYEGGALRAGKNRDGVLSSDAMVGVGLMKGWSIGIGLSGVLGQDVNDDSDRAEFTRLGTTDIKASSKWRLVGGRNGGIAFIFSANFNQLRDNAYLGKGAKPTLNYEFAMDQRFGDFTLGGNIGYRDRNPGSRLSDFPIAPLGDQFLASVATAYHWSNQAVISLEVSSAFPAQGRTQTVPNRVQSPNEMVLAYSQTLAKELTLRAGLGTELRHSTSSADLRVYVGVNYVLGPKAKGPTKVKPKPVDKTPGLTPLIETKDTETLQLDRGGKEVKGDEDEIFVLRGINFAFDSNQRVLPGTHDVLLRLAAHLRGKGYRKIVIEGHTDSTGTDQYNIDLSKRRAEAVRNHLTNFGGLQDGRLKTEAHGERRPVAENQTAEGRQQNRRVVFRVYY